jgi:hypothetical protein
VISAEYHTLEVSPEALNSVRGVRTYRELLLAVTDEDMVVFLVKSVVSGQFVGNRQEKKKTVIEKLKAFFEKYFGVV